MNESTPLRLDAETAASILADSEPYLSCDDCFDGLDVYVERSIADPTYWDQSMEVHLAACGACAEEAVALRDLLLDDGD